MYTLQISVDYSVVMQIVETAGDPNQLQSSELRILSPMRWAYQFQVIDSWVPLNVTKHISILHPLRNHAELEQAWRYAFNGQDIGMVHSLANYNFLAVFLDGASPVNPQSS